MGRTVDLARLGLLTGIAGSALLLGACTRPGAAVDATQTPVVTVRSSPSVVSTATRAATAVVVPSAAPSAAPVVPSRAPSAPPAATATTAPVAGRKYAVQSGDTLSAIAERFGVTIQQIIDANRLQNPDLLLPGQELIIPGQ